MAFIAMAVVGGIGSLASGAMQAGAARDAAGMQADAARDSNALQKLIFDQQRKDFDPYRQAGNLALYGNGGLFRRRDGGQGMAMQDMAAKKEAFINSKMADAQKQIDSAILQVPPVFRDKFKADFQSKMGEIRAGAEKEWANSPESQDQIDASQYEIDPELTRSFTKDDFVKDPGYDFRMAEGEKALARSAAAKGGLMGGAFGKALSRYGQDYASNEYNNAYNRFNADRANRFSRLSSLAGMGSGAADSIAKAGQNYANQVGNTNMSNANAQGAAGIASANAWGGTINNISKLAGDISSMNWMERQRKAQGGV